MRVVQLAEFRKESEILTVSYEPDTAIIGLGSGQTVRFDCVIGFRVLDERDLGEFWPACSLPHGGIFEILEGGWIDQESRRPAFISASERRELREFFITGPHSCVNVIGREDPKLEVRCIQE